MIPLSSAIAGVAILPLRQIEDARGAVLHMLRCDSPLFTRFGEIYFSLVFPGVVKAWKQHQAMTQHFAVPVGKIKLVIYDDREVSRSRGRIEAHILGRPDQYYLIRIPPLLWYGFQGVSPEPALLANCPDLPHDPQEVKGRPVSDPSIPYRWTVNNDPPG